MNLAVVFVTVCSVFVVCHLLRLVLAVEAFVRASTMSRCIADNHTYVPPVELICMESVSHLLILTNSSINFLIYCTLSTHFKVTAIDSSVLLQNASLKDCRQPLYRNTK
jgi:hypothetical protein